MLSGGLDVYLYLSLHIYLVTFRDGVFNGSLMALLIKCRVMLSFSKKAWFSFRIASFKTILIAGKMRYLSNIEK
jgi:hypothetical protein